MTEQIYDLTIIGGGPVGIYGAFYSPLLIDHLIIKVYLKYALNTTFMH